MASAFKLLVKFDSIATAGSRIEFTTSSNIVVGLDAYVNLSVVGAFEIGNNVTESAVNYKNALQRDYGQYFNISVNTLSNTVTIDGTDFDTTIDTNTWIEPDYVRLLYSPPLPPDPEFNITNITAQSADNTLIRNTHARYNISVENGVAPYQINTPVSKIALTSNDLFFDYERQPTISQNLNIEDDNSEIAISNMSTVDFFSFDSVTVNEIFNGSTAIGNITNQSGDIQTIKEYSLNNIDWQNSSSFTGLLSGNYTMYVRDNIGAFYSIEFDVIGISADKPDPYFAIPRANGFRFVPHSETNKFDCQNIANYNNALLSELFDEGKFSNVERKDFNQLISDCDIIPTQINTNYENVSVSIIDCNSNEVLTPTATLQKQYINQKDKRDCSFIQADDGKVVVIFGGGNIYEADTTNITGTYTNFNGSLQEFAINGRLFSITGTADINGDFKQLGEYYDVDQGKWGIKLDVTFVAGNNSGICQTLYDELIYNVFDFNTVGTALGNDIYKIIVSATDTDPRYNDVMWISEPIKKIQTKDTVIYEYSHKSNTANIDFSYGLTLKMRIPTRFIDGKTNEDSQDFVSDYGKKIVQKTIVTTSFMLESGLIPFYLVEKIAIASGMSNLSIDGIKYVKGDDSEAESLITQMNPFQKVNRSYQLDDTISIGEAIGIVTKTKTVIGSSANIAIGDNNP